MVTRAHLNAVALRLKNDLNSKAYKTFERTTLTTYLREESGEPTARFRSGNTGAATELTDILNSQGFLIYPPIAGSSAVRLYRSATVAGQLLDIIANPDPESDAQLACVVTKIKGKWNWTPTENPTTPTPHNADTAA